MWLINTRSHQLEEFLPEQCPIYAILSHRWQEGEVSFRDMSNPRKARRKKGFDKIRKTCQQACTDGINYAWIDTCCINKESSAELSEAINSMFNWYQNSEVCYVYLRDVHSNPVQYDEFGKSEWFRRGWTLQELIAPKQLNFYNSHWTWFGNKNGMLRELASITGIEEAALTCTDLSVYRAATKMSWAAQRTTTRREDIAYCLLGIFDVNMPLLYGEGHKAFTRLQEEIIKRFDDGTIFAWYRNEPGLTGLLSTSPSQFRGITQLNTQLEWEEPMHPPPRDIVITNQGISLTVYADLWSSNIWQVATGCSMDNGSTSMPIYLLDCTPRYGRLVATDCTFKRIHNPRLATDQPVMLNSCCCIGEKWPDSVIMHSYRYGTLKALVQEHHQRQFGLQETIPITPDVSQEVRFGFSTTPSNYFKLSRRDIAVLEHHNSSTDSNTYVVARHCHGLILCNASEIPSLAGLALGFRFDGVPLLIATTLPFTTSKTKSRRKDEINSLLTGKQFPLSKLVNGPFERSSSLSRQIYANIQDEMRFVGVGLETFHTACYPTEDGLWVVQGDRSRRVHFDLALNVGSEHRTLVECLFLPPKSEDSVYGFHIKARKES